MSGPGLQRTLFRVRLVTSWVIAAARLYLLFCAFVTVGAMVGLTLLGALGFVGVPIDSTWLTAAATSFPGFSAWTLYRRRRPSSRPNVTER